MTIEISPTKDLSLLTDEALLAETARVAEVERRSMAELLSLLIEVERRHLCERLGYPSLYVYCTKALGLSEQAAYSRITAARAIRRVPAMLPMLAEGSLTLSSVGLLAPHLTDENKDALLEAAQGQSTRTVERMIAAVVAQPDIPSSIRAAEGVPTRATVAPISAKRYVLKVTISEEAQQDLERAKALLRHALPSGDPAALVERALALLVREAERTKAATTQRPRAMKGEAANPQPRPTRTIPAQIKRLVWQRDHGRCAFVGEHGRCGETGYLEFHHVVPFADGGSTDVDNLQLRCRAHNAFEAREYFGAEVAKGALFDGLCGPKA